MPQRSTVPQIRRLLTVEDSDCDGLTDVLIDCVDGGASVSFMSPLSKTTARAFWQQIAGEVERGARALLVAELEGKIVGTVQLILEQPDNQPHRADLSKMLVVSSARRRGVGAALLCAAEAVGRQQRKTLLVLDTASADAERLYRRSGWQVCGVIPGFALWPHGGLCDTTFFYRQLSSASE